MTSTRMDDPWAVIHNRVVGYELVANTLERSGYGDTSSRFASGGTRSTVDDLIRFIESVAPPARHS